MKRKPAGKRAPVFRIEKETLTRGDGRKFVFYWFHPPRVRGRAGRKKA